MSKMKEYSLTLLLVIALVLSLSTNALALEACCGLASGCIDIDPFDCLGLGGISQGPGTDCAMTDICGTTQEDLEYGDAPEGSLAYPSSGTSGSFPTCTGIGPSGWIQHTNFGAWFGQWVDFESDGNAGSCPLFNPNTYDMDECFSANTGDSGLIKPEAYTITGPSGGETVTGLHRLQRNSTGQHMYYRCLGLQRQRQHRYLGT